MDAPGGVARPHNQRMDDSDLRSREPLMQVAFVVFVHEKTDRAAMHAVDRLAGIHEPLQGRQHEAVAAERDHHIRGLGAGVAVTQDQAGPRGVRLWTKTMNAWCLSIRPIRLLSRRSASAVNWSNGGCAPASISCPAWCRCIGGRAPSSGARRR